MTTMEYTSSYIYPVEDRLLHGNTDSTDGVLTERGESAVTLAMEDVR